MKRRRSSARSSILIGDDSVSKSSPSSSSQQPSSSKLARASAEPDEDGNEAHDVNPSNAPHTAALKCQLAPTCSGRGNECVFENAADMERHHATYHTHVCLDSGCGKVFPDARFLALHQTECHDPLIDIRKERGEKTFQCFLDTCSRKFLTPKNRRLHLIEAHSYPPEFFFAITNKGIGGLLERWGEGVSLVRGKWKERSPKDAAKEDDAMSTDGEDDGEDEREANKKEAASPASGRPRVAPPPPARGLAPTPIQRDPPPHLKGRGDTKASIAPPLVPSATSPSQTTQPVAPGPPTSKAPAPVATKKEKDTMTVDDALDSLTSTITSLSLVPRTVKFGRGKTAGFGQR